MPFSWKGNTHIRIGFEKNTVVANYVGNFPGVQWDKEKEFFYVLYTKTITHLLFDYFRARKYYVDYSQIIPPSTKTTKKGIQKPKKQPNLTQRNLELFKSYRLYLLGLRLSASTIATYSYFIALFLDFVDATPLSSLDNETYNVLSNR